MNFVGQKRSPAALMIRVRRPQIERIRTQSFVTAAAMLQIAEFFSLITIKGGMNFIADKKKRDFAVRWWWKVGYILFCVYSRAREKRPPETIN